MTAHHSHAAEAAPRNDARSDGSVTRTDISTVAGPADSMTADAEDYARRARSQLGFSRWWLLLAVAGMMGAVSPYQYAWSAIQGPLAEGIGVSLPALGAVFSLYVVFQSLSQFPVGWWRDRYGPRLPCLLAAALAGGGYVGLAYVQRLWAVYLLYTLGSIGVGIVYTVAINTALKWFPDRTGLTTGIGTMAFSGGSVVVVPYIRRFAGVDTYGSVLVTVGVVITVVVVLGSLVLRDPPTGWTRASDATTEPASGAATEAAYSTREMLRTWQFWLIYGMFVAIAGADLILIANVVGYAETVGYAAVVATLSATLLPVASGVSRIALGALYDRYHPRYVMAAAFLLAGVFRLLLVGVGGTEMGAVFVFAVLASIFFSSPLYVFFPSLIAEYYGTETSSGNYAIVYTAKIGGGIFAGSVAGVLIATVGWAVAFLVAAGLAIAAGIGALLLRPPGRPNA